MDQCVPRFPHEGSSDLVLGLSLPHLGHSCWEWD